jgi:hypothetical protein
LEARGRVEGSGEFLLLLGSASPIVDVLVFVGKLEVVDSSCRLDWSFKPQRILVSDVISILS